MFETLQHELSDLDRAAVLTTDLLKGAAVIPDDVVKNTMLHAALVARGNRFHERALKGLEKHPTSQGWHIWPGHWAVEDATEEEIEAGFDGMLNLEDQADKHQVFTINPGQHATFMLRPANEKRLIFFDPAADGTKSNRAEHVRRIGEAARKAGHEVVETGLQGSLGDLHQAGHGGRTCSYGMCSFLTTAVLRRTMDRAAAGLGVDPGKAAEDILTTVGKDRKLAQKLDMWMLASGARSAGMTLRAVMGAPKRTNADRKMQIAYEKMHREMAGDDPAAYHNKQSAERRRERADIEKQHAALVAAGDQGGADQAAARQRVLSNQMLFHEKFVPWDYSFRKRSAKQAHSHRRRKAGNRISHGALLLIAGTEIALHKLRKNRRVRR